jgi:hypothetical protein
VDWDIIKLIQGTIHQLFDLYCAKSRSIFKTRNDNGYGLVEAPSEFKQVGLTLCVLSLVGVISFSRLVWFSENIN